jgi:hypothetical protein
MQTLAVELPLFGCFPLLPRHFPLPAFFARKSETELAGQLSSVLLGAVLAYCAVCVVFHTGPGSQMPASLYSVSPFDLAPKE